MRVVYSVAKERREDGHFDAPSLPWGTKDVMREEGGANGPDYVVEEHQQHTSIHYEIATKSLDSNYTPPSTRKLAMPEIVSSPFTSRCSI